MVICKVVDKAQLEGFFDTAKPSYVCKLRKAFHG